MIVKIAERDHSRASHAANDDRVSNDTSHVMDFNGAKTAATGIVDCISNKTKTIFQWTRTACAPSEGLESGTSGTNPTNIPCWVNTTHEVAE